MDTNTVSSADKILEAATELFAANNYDATSIKEIAKLSGVNSALISYYFGGKKNLYIEVMNKQAAHLLALIDTVKDKDDLNPIQKIHLYTREVVEVQKQRPMQFHLIYRELLSPSGFCSNFVKSRLYRIHQFLYELVAQGIKEGYVKEMTPNYAAFTLESIIVFFFLTQNFVKELGAFDDDSADE
ncbi:MAG TPA: TetR/AcrR family transcriptional regulator, partial [Candidatus Avacidaminococcus intestinavium]|nr:TetR/AcrR family transcriptional regulator [Candidatus Avacidaminococcus intestinavium]